MNASLSAFMLSYLAKQLRLLYPTFIVSENIC